MSVVTNLLFLAICLSMLADGALNKRNKKHLGFFNQLRPRDISPNLTHDTPYPCLSASGSSGALLSSGFATSSGSALLPSGTANTASSFGSNRSVPYPTKGAPYINSTTTCTKQGNGEGENGQSGSGYQCPSQQTVTLPPQTITLPVQTVTITPTPETITVTPQAQTETVTVTVTPRIQTTTVTIWMTVTANQAPSCPSPGNTANSQIAPVPPPNAQPSDKTVAPVFNDTSTPPVVPPIATTPNLVVPLAPVETVPVANATLPVVPNISPTATNEPINVPSDSQTSPVVQQTSSSIFVPVITNTPIKAPYPYPNITNQALPLGSGSSRGFFRPTGSGFAKPTNRHSGNISTLLTPPSTANITAFRPTAGPTAPPSPTIEYFPDDGSSLLTPVAQANATVSPTMEYFPDDGSSLQVPPSQANATSVLPMGGPAAPIISTSSPPPMIQSNTSISTPPVSPILPLQPATPSSTPTPPPSTSIPSTPQPLTNNTPPSASTAQPPKTLPQTYISSSLISLFFHLHANNQRFPLTPYQFSELPPIPSTPLIDEGLNYTSFAPVHPATPNTTSPLPPTTHLFAPAASQPKRISIASSVLSFTLSSLSLSCGDDDAAVTTNCTVQIFGIGAPSASGAATGTGSSVLVRPGGMQTVWMEEKLWRGVSQVTFSAMVAGTPTGLTLGGLVYEVVSAC